MNIDEIISEIRHSLTATFSEIDKWFDQPQVLKAYFPENGGWNITQILEHIALTNHFLLIIIQKGTRKALQNIHGLDLDATLRDYTFPSKALTEVGIHQSFKWIRPEHMEPNGEKTEEEVRRWLREQLATCLDYLQQLSNGEGVLYKTTMSVNELGKIDVYAYIYFLAQHGLRHIAQMEKNKNEYLKSIV